LLQAIALGDFGGAYGSSPADNAFRSSVEKPLEVDGALIGKTQGTDSEEQDADAVVVRPRDMPLDVLLDNFSGHLGKMEAHLQAMINEVRGKGGGVYLLCGRDAMPQVVFVRYVFRRITAVSQPKWHAVSYQLLQEGCRCGVDR
jgi:hypothetical protein